MVAVAAVMIPMDLDPFEVLRAELVEGFAPMVNRAIQGGKAEAQSALGSIEEIRTTLANVANIDDFLEDLDAAERMLLLYLLTCPSPRAAARGEQVDATVKGAVTLGDIAGRIAMLEVACTRCERRGRYRVAWLIEHHGADMGLPELRTIIAADCPRMIVASTRDLCGAHLPQPATWG